MTDRFRAVTTARDRAKTLFEGLEKDARKFIENNFPRPHVEPPGSPDAATPDVVLVKPDGSKEQYHADDGWSAHGAPAATQQEGTQQEGSVTS